MGSEEASALAERLLAGDRDAISPALNLVDDRRPEQQARARVLLEALEGASASERGHRVGLTGAPGAGKSSLLDALVRQLRQRDQAVGILAVDPSSQKTGGALLGDRFRLRSGARDRGVFLRSMAARDRLGGLADATHASVHILSAVFDLVFVETVGVGQSESDVAHLVDTLVFVAQPAAGDLLQFMKAGLLELPDVFAVNKSDLGPEAGRTAGELSAGLGMGEGLSGEWARPVLQVSAHSGEGIEELVNAIASHRDFLKRSESLSERRRRGQEAFALDALERRYGSYGLACLGGRGAAAEELARRRHESVFTGLSELGRRIEAALAASEPGEGR